jgi:hypothetical protein
LGGLGPCLPWISMGWRDMLVDVLDCLSRGSVVVEVEYCDVME